MVKSYDEQAKYNEVTIEEMSWHEWLETAASLLEQGDAPIDDEQCKILAKNFRKLTKHLSHIEALLEEN